jgi:hypothetical protein
MMFSLLASLLRTVDAERRVWQRGKRLIIANRWDRLRQAGPRAVKSGSQLGRA